MCYIFLADGHQPYKRLYTRFVSTVDEFETRMPCVIIVIDLCDLDGAHSLFSQLPDAVAAGMLCPLSG